MGSAERRPPAAERLGTDHYIGVIHDRLNRFLCRVDGLRRQFRARKDLITFPNDR
jgi:hypothetical protein